MQSRIPKRIIQTGRSLPLPLRERAAVAGLETLNPDFERLFFDDQKIEDFFREETAEHQEVLKLFRFPIQKFDFFRYLAIYRYGGFYFDLDVFLASGLSELLDCGCVFSFEDVNVCRFLRERYRMDWAVANYAFGAVPGDPFLKAIINNCIRAQKDPEWVKPMLRGIPRLVRAEFEVLSTTGPLLVSRTLVENPALAEQVTILFPEEVCDTRNCHNFGNFGVHLMNGSWRAKYGPVRRRLAGMWEVWAFKKCVRESLQLQKTRWRPPRTR
jgi:hypothetical protein